jgi:hypothetical protein
MFAKLDPVREVRGSSLRKLLRLDQPIHCRRTCRLLPDEVSLWQRTQRMAAKTAGAAGGAEFVLHTASPIELRLDPDNPRLPASDQGASQPRLREIMIERFKITELAESIVTAGYNAFDPLVGTQAKEGADITILEGNRRVATLLGAPLGN